MQKFVVLILALAVATQASNSLKTYEHCDKQCYNDHIGYGYSHSYARYTCCYYYKAMINADAEPAPVAPAEPTPVDPAAPAEPTPAEPTPVDPAAPVDPAKPVDPATPADPAKPEEETKSSKTWIIVGVVAAVVLVGGVVGFLVYRKKSEKGDQYAKLA